MGLSATLRNLCLQQGVAEDHRNESIYLVYWRTPRATLDTMLPHVNEGDVSVDVAQ